jgi:hypothetical protein
VVSVAPSVPERTTRSRSRGEGRFVSLVCQCAAEFHARARNMLRGALCRVRQLVYPAAKTLLAGATPVTGSALLGVRPARPSALS